VEKRTVKIKRRSKGGGGRSGREAMKTCYLEFDTGAGDERIEVTRDFWNSASDGSSPSHI
jgi:hypothetical protein